MESGFILNDRKTILRFIQRAIDDNEELKAHVVKLNKGTIVFKQGEKLPFLYLLLEGSAKLTHTRHDGSSLDLVKLEPGHFVGLVAFTTGNASLTTCSVLDDAKALKIEQREFERYVNDHPRLRHPLQQLMMNNMTDRFLKNVELESRMNSLNKKLEKEGKELKNAYQQLEDSHQRLVHQEKMATLGELVAGFAHEVNNPAAALLRSSEALKENFVHFSKNDPLDLMFRIGLESEPVSSVDVRNRMLVMQKQFPFVNDRSTVRKLAQMPDKAIEIIDSSRKKIPIDQLIQQFESGKLIHNIKVASERIANLVKSLKSYSRQDNNEADMIDIRLGIQDTILILTNRIKYLDLSLNLEDLPLTCGKMGELNQVWTNIIVNACDALPKKGRLDISCQFEKPFIKVIISDNGPGIAENIIDRIFEPNFTTKNQGAEFGLGLGLAISNEIIRKHGGKITASNKKEGGAKFEIRIPVKDC